MKLLDGADLAGFIQTRHAQIVASLSSQPQLAILYTGDSDATQRYIRAKRAYGASIGIDISAEKVEEHMLKDAIVKLNHDISVTGIIVQLPLQERALEDEVIGTIAPTKDVDGLGEASTYEPATPKGILWLLAGYNIDLKGQIAIVGQGRLIGKPLADSLEDSGRNVARYDESTAELALALLSADIIISASGKPSIIDSSMVKVGAVVIDAGSPESELAEDLRSRTDLTITPNPGGVGPMTVAALFDNLLLAAQK
jgi:methylenetetrahydrofolate dehydrogenase (NADP+)/methenyltetrahydrofolate cyclohydrolase